MTNRPKPVVLCILDGWGCSDTGEHNALQLANTPHFDRFMAQFPHSRIEASELDVGLPPGQMGNSEVGHMNIGAGRIVMQDLPRIDAAIEDGTLARDPQLLTFIATLKQSGGVAHLMGLLSDGGVHAHIDHLMALATILDAHGIPTYLHGFLDGRDTPPKSAATYLQQLENHIASLTQVKLVTLSGRFYAMDRDQRWERIEPAYRAMVEGNGYHAANAHAALQHAYDSGKSDEFVPPAVLGEYAGMKSGDGLLFANFRADRARQLLAALVDPSFAGFTRTPVAFAARLGMVEYSDALAAFLPALFPPQTLNRILSEVVADAGLKQLHIAETEKYAHVTFFFNGGREEPFAREERILVPSPKVATYDLKPEMSAYEVTQQLVDAIAAERFDFIVVNYANADMVGHTGDMAAAVKAVEVLDDCLGKLYAAVEAVGGVMLVSADHGNIEMMHDHDTEQAHTAHTLNPVPCLLLGHAIDKNQTMLANGKLADLAPTILQLLQLSQPPEMTGQSLLRRADS